MGIGTKIATYSNEHTTQQRLEIFFILYRAKMAFFKLKNIKANKNNCLI